MMEGVENEENATFALLMHAYDKALSFPFLPLPLLPSFRFLINTEKDLLKFSFLLLIKEYNSFIVPDVFIVIIIRNRS